MSTIARKFRPLQEAVLRHRRTIFNDTHLSLEKWYMAVALMVNAKKGVSAKQLQRDLGTAYQDKLVPLAPHPQWAIPELASKFQVSEQAMQIRLESG